MNKSMTDRVVKFRNIREPVSPKNAMSKENKPSPIPPKGTQPTSMKPPDTCPTKKEPIAIPTVSTASIIVAADSSNPKTCLP